MLIVGPVPPGPVEHEKDVVAVVVELRALAEVLGVLQRERMKPEDLAEPGQLIGTRIVEVEPEEVIALEMVTDARLVDTVEAWRDEAELVVAILLGDCFGLADSHGRLLVAKDVLGARPSIRRRRKPRRSRCW